MRAAGVSAWRFVLPAAGAAFLLAALITALVLFPFLKGVKANGAALVAADAA